MGKPKKKQIKDNKPLEEQKVIPQETYELYKKIMRVKLPKRKKIKQPRSKKEIFDLIKEGKLQIKSKTNRVIVVKYKKESTKEALERENKLYIKHHLQKPGIVTKKKNIKQEYLLVKGQDRKGQGKLWMVKADRNQSKKLKPYVTPVNFDLVYENDLDKLNEIMATSYKIHDERNRPPGGLNGMYDRMKDEYLCLFDENVRNENGKKRRYTSLELFGLEEGPVLKMIQPYRSSLMERLKKFEDERNDKKRKTLMLECEKQKYVRKYKADEAKKKYLNILINFTKEKSEELKANARKIEDVHYNNQLNKFRVISKLIFEKLMKEMYDYNELLLAKEISETKALIKQRREEAIMTTAIHKEKELKESFEQICLPFDLGKQKEDYYFELSSYIQYWKKHTHKIEKEVDIQKKYLKKHLETNKILQSVEHIPAVKQVFADKVKRVQEEGKIKVEEALVPLREKFQTVQKIRKENRALVELKNCFVTILPEFLNKLKEFIDITQKSSFVKETLFETLDQINGLKKSLMKQSDSFMVELSSKSSSSGSISYPVHTKSSMSIVKGTHFEEKKEEEMVFDMANRILSDGELEEGAKQLLKVKFIIIDILKKVIPDNAEVSDEKEEEEKEKSTVDFKSFNTVETYTKTDDEVYITKTRKKIKSFLILDKLLQVNEKIDETFIIVGEKYSRPDLVGVAEYLNKRTMSVERIIKKHNQMLEDIKMNTNTLKIQNTS